MLSLSSHPEKIYQKLRCLVLHQPELDLRHVVERLVPAHAQDRAAGAVTNVARTDDEPLYPRVNNGAGAHGARLLGDVQVAPGEPLVAERRRGRLDGVDLRVAHRVAAL